VEFYSSALGLPVLGLPVLAVRDDAHSKLTTLGFGENTYLMFETGGTSTPTAKSLDQNPVWLRFNVKSVEDAVSELSNKGIEVEIRKEACAVAERQRPHRPCYTVIWACFEVAGTKTTFLAPRSRLPSTTEIAGRISKGVFVAF